jgi:hypothetical protein
VQALIGGCSQGRIYIGCRSRVGIDGSLELLLAERARGDDPEPPVHALEVEHVRARQLPHLLLLPVLRQADAALLQLRFRNKFRDFRLVAKSCCARADQA